VIFGRMSVAATVQCLSADCRISIGW